MLPLSRQNAYRERYRAFRPGWRTSGEAFEALTRQYIGPGARVLDLGCGRGGVMELFWREVKLPVGLDPDHASLDRLPYISRLARNTLAPAHRRRRW